MIFGRVLLLKEWLEKRSNIVLVSGEPQVQRWSSRFHKQLLLTITAWAILATLILLNTQLWAEGAPRNFPLYPNTFYFLSMTSCATFSERICWLFSGTEVARTLFVSSALLLVLAFVGQSHHLGLSCCQHHLIFAYCSAKSTSTCNWTYFLYSWN